MASQDEVPALASESQLQKSDLPTATAQIFGSGSPLKALTGNCKQIVCFCVLLRLISSEILRIIARGGF